LCQTFEFYTEIKEAQTLIEYGQSD
jgi:hypothetical protein